MKKFFAVIGLLGLVFQTSANEIDWGTSASRRIYDNDGFTALSTNLVTKTSNTACFVQLVYAGLNGVADSANKTGTGAMTDDVVVATTYIGKNMPTSQANSAGRFNMSGISYGYDNTTYVDGSKFFIRAWDLPATDYNAGTVPTDGYYGNSQIFTVSKYSINQLDQFVLTSDFSTTLQAIPEPGALVIGLAGVGLLVGYRRYKLFAR